MRPVLPEPDIATATSPLDMLGTMVSPSTYELKPRCRSRMAKALPTRPLLPAPITRTFPFL
jgi:hypothetical protein